jgi:hypothetical protein
MDSADSRRKEYGIGPDQDVEMAILLLEEARDQDYSACFPERLVPRQPADDGGSEPDEGAG